jgi:hypothetical protein
VLPGRVLARTIDPRTTALAIIGMCNWVAWWSNPVDGSHSSQTGAQLASLALAMVARHDGRLPTNPGPRDALTLIREDLDFLERTLGGAPLRTWRRRGRSW